MHTGDGATAYCHLGGPGILDYHITLVFYKLYCTNWPGCPTAVGNPFSRIPAGQRCQGTWQRQRPSQTWSARSCQSRRRASSQVPSRAWAGAVHLSASCWAAWKRRTDHTTCGCTIWGCPSVALTTCGVCAQAHDGLHHLLPAAYSVMHSTVRRMADFAIAENVPACRCRQLRREPGHSGGDPHLGGGLRAGRLRQRRHHGGTRP